MKCAIVDERISKSCERSLLLHGFRVIKCPPSKKLSEAVKSHPDMLMFYHEKALITSADFCDEAPHLFADIREACDGVGFTFTADVFGKEYPRDVLFNALTSCGMLFAKTDSISNAVIEYAKKTGLKIVHTKQGYPACTALSFGKSAITSDKGLFNILSSEGVCVTLIEDGDILLPPHEYGFIGGCAGVFEDTVYFLGNLDTHRDAEKIKAAILRENMKFVSLSDEPLADLGRIVFVG